MSSKIFSPHSSSYQDDITSSEFVSSSKKGNKKSQNIDVASSVIEKKLVGANKAADKYAPLPSFNLSSVKYSETPGKMTGGRDTESSRNSSVKQSSTHKLPKNSKQSTTASSYRYSESSYESESTDSGSSDYSDTSEYSDSDSSSDYSDSSSEKPAKKTRNKK